MMEDLDEWEIWDKYPHHRNWLNKLYLAYSLNYQCGPGGYPVPESKNYIVRPVYNLAGMGLGARLQFLEAGDRSSVPPGYFWCECFDGPHYSATYQFCHDTLPYWKPLSCWQGTNSALNLTKFTRWIRIPDYAPQVPRQLNVLSDVRYINIEFKGDKPIEVHLRPSGNPDGSIHSDYNEYIPVWESGEHDAITMFQKGYSFIPNSTDMSDVDAHTVERRLGFFVR
jgi:hypothetical protein